jgi:hypothetical protein
MDKVELTMDAGDARNAHDVTTGSPIWAIPAGIAAVEGTFPAMSTVSGVVK